jgi:hypothetical protein
MDNWGKKTVIAVQDGASSFATILIFAIAAAAQIILYVFDPKRKIENR